MIVLSFFILVFSSIFASGISFTQQQCERFKADGVTGGDYYLNEALERDCGVQPQAEDGYFMPLVLKEDPQHCEMKNQAFNKSNSGYLQDVVTFNNMHPDYFYPDRDDEYPFVFALRVPDNKGGYYYSNGVAVDIDSMDGCREKLESLLNNKLDKRNVILTTAHSLAVNVNNPNCRLLNKTGINRSVLAAGPNVGSKPFATKLGKVVCSSRTCDQFIRDEYNDFCIIIPEKDLPKSAEFERLDINKLQEISYLVAYQPTLVSSLKNRNIKNSERIISVNKDGHVLQNKNTFTESKDKFILHHADAARGASGGGLFNNEKKLFGISTSEGNTEDKKIQRGYKYTGAVNYAIDPQIACQRLSNVLN